MSIGKFSGSAIGNLGRDPELKVSESGVNVCRFSIAVNRRVKGEDTVTWVNVTAFNKTAEICNKHLVKGSLVSVDGDIEVRTYEGRDHTEKTSVGLVAHNVIFLSKKDSPEGESAPVNEEDIPF